MKIERYYSGYKDGYEIDIFILGIPKYIKIDSVGDIESARLSAMIHLNNLKAKNAMILYIGKGRTFAEEIADSESVRFEDASSSEVNEIMKHFYENNQTIRTSR